MEETERRGRVLGPVARSRLTNHERITDDEKAVLWDAIGSDARQIGFSSKPSNIDAESESQTRRIREMTDRELIGAIITGSAPKLEQRIVSRCL